LPPDTIRFQDSHVIRFNSSCYNTGMNENSTQIIARLAALACEKQLKICTAESCTGGLIAKSFTELAGSSDWFECGFVTYSNQSKTEMIGVPESVIAEYGAVSEAVVNAMASGALRNSAADVAIAVTGVAGPAGGSDEKPVGTVWIGVASSHQQKASKYHFDGNREAIREAAMRRAIEDALVIIET